MIGIDRPTSVVIVGHVDHGKSTFIGRLLHDTGNLSSERFEDIRKASADLGRRLEYAFVTDQFKEERSENVTIDTTQVQLEISSRPFLLIDAPGHKEYLRNMITGATQAEHGLLLLDVTEGVREQTDKHVRLLKLVGLRRIGVLLNKMDLADFEASVFERCERDVRALFERCGLPSPAVIPVSAYEGDNIATASRRMPWYKGPTGLDFLLSCKESNPVEGNAVVPVQLLYTHEGQRLVMGRVESGTIRVRQKLSQFPSQATFEIDKIFVGEKTVAFADAGVCVALSLTENPPLQRGDVLHAVNRDCAGAARFTAETFWAANASVKAGDHVQVECRTQSAPCEVSRVMDEEGTRELVGLEGSELGQLELRMKAPLLVEPGLDAVFSRVVFYRSGEVVGCGMVLRVD